MKLFKPLSKLLLAGMVFLTGTALLISSSAMAGIEASAHDFASNANTSGWAGEICNVCHTPHNGNGSTNAPLWDRVTTGTATFGLYTGTGGSLDATITQPSGLSLLCLSCHDGTVALDNSGVNTDTMATIDSGNSAANFGTDLSDDHPISFTFDTALETADGELNDPTRAPVAALLIGGAQGTVECASCHDVHNTAIQASLLVMSNANSDLCLVCHDK